MLNAIFLSDMLSTAGGNGANLVILFILSVFSTLGSSVIFSVWFTFLEHLYEDQLPQFFFDPLTIGYILGLLCQ